MDRPSLETILNHPDISRYLVQFLDASSHAAFYRIDYHVTKSHRFKLTHKEVVTKELKRLGVDPSLVDYLGKGACLAGSFVMRCMLIILGQPAKWESNDIDIFAADINDPYLVKWPLKPGTPNTIWVPSKKSRGINFTTSVIPYLMKNAKFKNTASSYGNAKFSQLRDWSIDDFKINEIVVDKDTDIRSYVWKEFDLDFCKCVFDGERLYTYGDALRTKTCEFNLGKHTKVIKVSKETEFNTICATIVRKIKYENRGFKIKMIIRDKEVPFMRVKEDAWKFLKSIGFNDDENDFTPYRMKHLEIEMKLRELAQSLGSDLRNIPRVDGRSMQDHVENLDDNVWEDISDRMGNLGFDDRDDF